LSEYSSERVASASNLLSQFGLSKDEAGLFVLLSRVGKRQPLWLKGSDLSKLSKKSRVRTYQILQRLVSLGLVNVDLSRPKRYTAVPPQVALRRLLAIQETRLTELSHLENEAIESLRNLSRVEIQPVLGEVEEKRSAMALLQGLANIQIALRERLLGPEISISINAESAEHIAAVLGYLSEGRASTRIIFSAPKISSLRSHRFPAENTSIYWRRGNSPTFILANDVTMFLFYSKSVSRRRLLTPEARLSTVSQMALIEDETYSKQMRSLFELMLQNSSVVSKYE
jgi:sugar-specific transcriptional regulator TrmB